MNTHLQNKVFFWTSFILLFIQSQNVAIASHAQSADLTYQCLGGNQYQISLSFYRDCAGVAAPTTATINIASASCGENLTVTLNQIPGTGTDVTPICASMTTQCAGGTNPGVQEFIYSGIVTLPAQCVDWVFSFSLCCRNTSIGTIASPGTENIYVEAHLDNYHFPCNSSPVFSNPPIPFVCVNQPYCFNNGSFDPDGDSLSYTLIAPYTSATTTVTYNSPYTALQPLASMPAVNFNPLTGDMCMTPTQLQVTVFAILVQEWRNGELVGSVMRDVQLRTITCTNNNPFVNGINNTGQYSMTACAGVPINFNISTFDVDAAQNVSIAWNNGITGATFTSGSGSRPVANFSWTPDTSHISTASHCFTVTVMDDNCPYNGSQTYSFCITVGGLTLSTTATDANCNASNGFAEVTVLSGPGPYTYQWVGLGTNAIQHGLYAGTYTVTVTGAGCAASATAIVGAGAAPGNLVMETENVSCHGAADGTAFANMNGGQQPYAYSWSTGSSAATLTGLSPGTYSVSVTTANGCISADTIVITQPATALSYSSSSVNVSCFGGNDGSASVIVSGGTAPYSYNWNSSPAQTSATASALLAGTYSVLITDDNGCTVNSSFAITQPPAINANAMVVSNVSCNGMNDGAATVGASGGTGAFSYQWNTSPAQSIQSVNYLAPATYEVTVTDANGCTAQSSITITQPAPLSLSTAAFPVTCHNACNGQTVVIPAGGSPGYSYQWSPGGGTSASASGLCAGTYSIVVTDANGCNANATLVVTQPAPLVLSTSSNTTICLGQNTTLSAIATGGTASYTYSWTGVGVGASQTVSPTVATIYTVTATDANGCVSAPANVAVNVTSLTAANLSVAPATIMCFGDNASVYSAVTGNTGPVSIAWSGGLGAGNGPFTVSPPASTTYTVTVTDACGNSVSGLVPVTVNPLPVIDIAPQTGVACSAVNINYQDNSTGNAGAQYYWSFGDGGTSSQVSPSHVYTNSGVYTVDVFVTSIHGCVNSASTSTSITVHPPSQAAFNSEGLDGSTINPLFKFHNTSYNTANSFWTFGDGNTSSVTEPMHTYASKGQYIVTLYTESVHGCKDSVRHTVEVRPEFTIYIPNAFTPDANGSNDIFTAKGDEITEFRMMIFDRWGELIFTTDDMTRGWDGTANGASRIAENGVYVYKITVRDFEHRYHDFTGHVTLLSYQK
jgi:gliding motility-associated-like protein